MARRKFLMGNWKMFKTVDEAISFVNALKEGTSLPGGVEYSIAPPFTAISTLGSVLPDDIHLGAQNVHFEKQGAFTGEVSASMLSNLGVRYVIVGHSERRHVFGESDEMIRHKVKAVFEAGMIPVLCVGEDLRERQLDHTLRVCERQTRSGLAEISAEQAAQLVIAYEPVWAIGSGLTATPDDAENVIQSIRGVVAEDKGQAAADACRILYGGSVKPENIASFTQQSNIDGALVGGASLEASSFARMAAAVAEGAK